MICSDLCRLRQDVYQTAKIAKLFLMMDKGEGAECQGKTLEEIDVQLKDFSDTKSDIDGNLYVLNFVHFFT
jgi:hypothetical protein